MRLECSKRRFTEKQKFGFLAFFLILAPPPQKKTFLRFFCQNVNFLTFSHHTAKKKCEKSKIFLEKVFSCDIPPGNQISWSYHHYWSTEKRYLEFQNNTPPRRKIFDKKSEWGVTILGSKKCLLNRFSSLRIDRHDQNGHLIFQKFFGKILFFSSKIRGGVIILELEVHWILTYFTWI